MAGRRYTSDQLLHLRQSPLVQKPADLPSIEQWLDQPPEQNQRKPRTQNGRAEEPSPMGNFSSQRPSLLQTRQISRTAGGDDVVLGPPRTSFASSRSFNKLADSDDKASRGVDDEENKLRSFRDRDGGLASKERDGWGTKRTMDGRGALGDREKPYGRNPRERGDRSLEEEDDNTRRNGYGQKQDQRWSRDGERQAAKPAEGRSWRDRDRRFDKEWERGGQVEKDPEWMDEPLEKEEPQAHTAAEFERWKERMRSSKAPNEKENVELPVEEPLQPLPKASAPLVAEGLNSGFFGSWADNKRAESGAQAESPAPKPAATKAKASRFASIFAPKDEPRPVAEPPLPSPLAAAANGSSEDKEGFQRMLQMLRGTTMASKSDSPLAVASPSNQGLAGFFGPPAPKPAHAAAEDRVISLPQSPQGPSRSTVDNRSASRHVSRPESGFSGKAPQSAPEERSESHSRQQSRPNEMSAIFLDQPPRNISTPEAQNIQSLLAGQRTQKTPALNKDSEFLLNLIQAKNANRPPSQARAPERDNFQLFLDQPPKTQTHAPQPRQPPPGFLDNQLFQGREQGPDINQPPPEHQARPRPPPGFYDDPSILQHGQASFNAERRPQGPPGFLPSMFQGPPGPPGPPSHMQPERMPPPPGFHANPRQPHLFANIPNMIQQPSAQGPPHARGPPGDNIHQGPPPPHMQHRLPPGLSDNPPHPAAFGGMIPPPGFFGGPPHAQGVPPGFGNGPPLNTGNIVRNPGDEMWSPTGELPPGMYPNVGPRR